MTDSTPDWGPWIEHDGSGVPEGVEGRFLGVYSENPLGRLEYSEGLYRTSGIDNVVCWSGGGTNSSGEFLFPVRCYRIRRPRALQQLVDLAANLPAIAPSELEGVS